MRQGWYLRFFTPAFWAVADQEYTRERTRAEVDYLERVLGMFSPGCRVTDLGCGTGRHAIELARRGFQVTGFDVSGWALRQAKAAADSAGVHVTWDRLDLLTERHWPGGPADACVCIQSFGWGSDAEQLEFLRKVRDYLRPDGVLVLDHSNVNAILNGYAAKEDFTGNGVSARFHRSYDVVSGRSAGWIDVRRAGRRPVRIKDDVRLYPPAEVGRMLSEAGFGVERATADFAAGRAPAPGTRYVQFVARRRPPWRDPLDAYADGPAAHAADRLDLRWSPDEAAFVEQDLDAAWHAVASRDELRATARSYAVTDPFSGARCAPVLSQHLGAPLSADMVTCGAGATGLLHAAAMLAGRRPVVHGPFGHPALPRWAVELGATTIAAWGEARLLEVMAIQRPGVTVLDRPDLTGGWLPEAAISRLASAAAKVGGLLVIDEAYATYAPPSASAAAAVSRHDNLIVIRSMSKGYCCGGLRVGFALTSPAAGRLLRSVAPPLAASALPLVLSLALLERGDVLAPLRRRVREVKPGFARALECAGLRPLCGDPDTPWVTAPADARARAALASARIIAKEIHPQGTDGQSVLKLAVPLSCERVQATSAALAR
jgi:histidinol-phosphate/aromatic aminotransferase/cobyric acid decarboxylase-like protein/SAM-dependent methyltransferase